MKNGVELELDARPGVDVIEGDERRVRQVVFNLLSNAVKFTPEGGRVDVRTAAVDGEVTISVADTGPGIAPEDQELIFEEFRQARVVERRAPARARASASPCRGARRAARRPHLGRE